MQLREEQRGLSYPDVRLWRGEAEVLHMSEATANSYCPLGSASLEMEGVLRHGCGGQSWPLNAGKETETVLGWPCTVSLKKRRGQSACVLTARCVTLKHALVFVLF